MKLFRLDTTFGYTNTELDLLNAEFETFVSSIDQDTEEYFQAGKQFSNEISRRQCP
jgi:hypothetical protein